MRSEDCPIGIPAEAFQAFVDRVVGGWGTGKSAKVFAPSVAADPAFRRAWVRIERNSASPARAIRCACAICDGVRAFGIEIRAGLHAGECEDSGDDVAGIAVHIGARAAASAEPGEVRVSGTVEDLVAGSDLTFGDRGSPHLRGVPGERRLFAVEG